MDYNQEIKAIINRVPEDYYNYGEDVAQHILDIQLPSGYTIGQVLDIANKMQTGDTLGIMRGKSQKRPDLILSEDK